MTIKGHESQASVQELSRQESAAVVGGDGEWFNYLMTVAGLGSISGPGTGLNNSLQSSFNQIGNALNQLAPNP